MTERALRFAWSLSPDIRVLHVECGEESEDLRQRWSSLAEAPAKKAGLPVPNLVVVKSPFRFVVGPIVDYILELEKEFPDRQFAVLIPELVDNALVFLPPAQQSAPGFEGDAPVSRQSTCNSD